ncbi:MAG: glycosyltransferase family 39 protein [Candidatus Omnitrophica bacterium]|nr:glycosyltransferase family 39 protein [Candidatus Omnitrophota bacterium]
MKENKFLIGLIIIASFLFMFNLGKMALTDPDEPFYAQSAREMMVRGEWLTPRIFSEPQFEKPPMYYWLIISSYKMFGVNEFSARFPSALFGIIGIIGIFLLSKQLFNKRAGFFAGIIMATSVQYAILARACVTDMVLCVFILYIFLFYFKGYYNDNNKKYYISAAFFTACAVLTKGPVGFILPAFIIFLFLILTKDWKAIFKYSWLEGAVIFCLVALPWFIVMTKVYGQDFTGHFFGFQNVTRFLQPEHKGSDIIFYYVPIVIVGFLPWILFLPYAVTELVKKDKQNIKKHLMLVLWIGVFFVFFSISKTKLPTYIFPLFPALAILTGRFLDIVWENKIMSKTEKSIGMLLPLSFFIATIVGYFLAKHKYPLMSSAIIFSGVVLCFSTLFCMIQGLKNQKKGFYLGIVCSMILAIMLLNSVLAKPIGLYESSKYFVEKANELKLPDEVLGGEDDNRRGIAFYADIENVPDLHDQNILNKFILSEKRNWGIMKTKNLDFLYEYYKDFKPTYIVYKMGKKVLFTNKKPDQDVPYIVKGS